MSVTIVDDDIVQARPPCCSRCGTPITGQGNIGGRCHNTKACEGYIDPFPHECDHGVPDGIRCGECAAEMEEYEHEWECAYPDKCLAPSPVHLRSECYTIEDAEAYYAEVEGIKNV